MNLEAIFLKNIPIFMLLFLVFFIVYIFRTSWFKGILGEFIVNSCSAILLDKKLYYLIKNVTITTNDGTTQIDHIIVSQYGIFVVETKNMKGWIFGKQNQANWTQQIFKKKYKFQNPLYQNYKHVQALLSLLNVSKDKVFSLIVFVGDSTFKSPMPVNVTSGIGYLKFIKSKKEKLFSDSEVLALVHDIENNRLARSLVNNQKHVDHVREIVAKKKQQVNQPLCPKCAGEMIKRVAKKGSSIGTEFWGCKRFPNCRGVVNEK